ncbi:MAG TPA: hypothetical protein VFD39_14580, partial [Trueperaceae bacterium]|nr:hypothetical protein [Trueperaceae bacterium]
GLLSAESFAGCVGGMTIDVPGDGMHFFGRDQSQGSSTAHTMSGDLYVTMGTESATGRAVFVLEVRGTAQFGSGSDRVDSPARALLTVDLGGDGEDMAGLSWPRGIYRFGEGSTGFRLDLEDAPAGTFVASHGFVLVTSATSDRIEGSIVLQRADRPFAPMGVPYAADELPRVTFRVSGSRP